MVARETNHVIRGLELSALTSVSPIHKERGGRWNQLPGPSDLISQSCLGNEVSIRTGVPVLDR